MAQLLVFITSAGWIPEATVIICEGIPSPKKKGYNQYNCYGHDCTQYSYYSTNS